MALRAVLDTSISISIFLQELVSASNPPYPTLMQAIDCDKLTPVYSGYCRDELRQLLTEGHLAKKYNIDRDLANEFIDYLFYEKGEYIEITGLGRYCSDPKDDPIIETAIVAKAEYIVAKDQHFREASALLALKQAGVQVRYPDEFLEDLYWLEGFKGT